MTILRPKKNKSAPNKLAVFLAAVSFLGVLWLVVLFNQTVTVEHDVSKLSLESQSVEAKNAELKDELFLIFDKDSAGGLARERALIEEKNPEYLEVYRENDAWALASHF